MITRLSDERSVTIKISGEDYDLMVWLCRLNESVPSAITKDADKRKEYQDMLNRLRHALTSETI